MKLFPIFLSAVLLLLVACAGVNSPLPPLSETVVVKESQACTRIFPQGKWQFVHSIDFSMAGGAGSTLLGVTTLSGKSFQCALVTVEGFTLFEAVYHGDKSIEVRRAVPPFDNKGFAEGMVRDIRAIFQPPQRVKVEYGEVAGAGATCRYYDVEGRVVDVLSEIDDCWQIKGYTLDLVLDRSIVGRSCRKKESSLIPEYLELKSHGRSGYTLKMTLIRVDTFK